jgi:hypothetical protein
MQINKKAVIIAGAVLVFFAVVSVVASKTVFKEKPPVPSPSPSAKPKISMPVNVKPVEERPYVTVSPTAAREVVMTVHTMPKKASTADFEMTYSSAEKEEAAIGALDLSGGLPASKTILLGSKSGGGKITYHEKVSGGNLVLTFYDENYRLSNEWSYWTNTPKQTGFSSRDAKFQMVTGKLLDSAPYVIVYTSPGLPEGIEGTIVAGPYAVSIPGKLPSGETELSVRLMEEAKATMYGWDGTAWVELKGIQEGKQWTGKTELYEMYVGVKK